MSIFDILVIEAPCPSCAVTQSWHIQFKFGSCRHHHYQIGDTIEWSSVSRRYDNFRRVGGRVRVVGAVLGACGTCRFKGEENWGIDAYIYFNGDQIEAAEVHLEPLQESADGFEPLGGQDPELPPALAHWTRGGFIRCEACGWASSSNISGRCEECARCLTIPPRKLQT